MIIKRYLVDNINEALTKIRYELGKDAVIISQRKVRKSGIKGLLGGKLIEVTAAVENSRNSNNAAIQQNHDLTKEEEFKNSVDSIKRLMEKHTNHKSEEYLNQESNVKTDINDNVDNEKTNKVNNQNINDSIYGEVNELKSLIKTVIQNTAKDESNSEQTLLNLMNELDIDSEFKEEILENSKPYMNNFSDLKEILKSVLAKDISISQQELKGRVVLVGPTGVGKTTTIAKLAGRLALVEKKKIGLITVDTYRIGAIEQLKTYAEIMNIPFKVVITIKEMNQAVKSMEDCDVILIDTTGRSSKNTMQISELRTFVEKANPDYVNVVISATTKNRDIKNILKGYSQLNYNGLIITKLDETTVYGSLYNICKRADRPVNFITTGQNVPDDIKVPTENEILRFILGEENL